MLHHRLVFERLLAKGKLHTGLAVLSHIVKGRVDDRVDRQRHSFVQTLLRFEHQKSGWAQDRPSVFELGCSAKRDVVVVLVLDAHKCLITGLFELMQLSE